MADSLDFSRLTLDNSDAGSIASSASSESAQADDAEAQQGLDVWARWLCDFGTMVQDVRNDSAKGLQILQDVLVEVSC